MGEARRRGTFEERRHAAELAGRKREDRRWHPNPPHYRQETAEAYGRMLRRRSQRRKAKAHGR